MILTADMERANHWPFDLFDANGLCIYRAVRSFNVQTGEVESFACDSNGSFRYTVSGCAITRVEYFPAPLSWRKISEFEAKASQARLWDLQGR